LFFGRASGFFAKKWRQATSAESPTESVRRSSEAPHITYGGLQMRVRDGKRTVRKRQLMTKSGKEERLSLFITHCSFVIGPEITR
jgi:hypothetical protein